MSRDFSDAHVHILSAAGSHEGNVRPRNEDSYIARRPCYFVADGMGGHTLGDVASQAAVTAFHSLIGREWAEREDIHHAIAEARSVIKGLAVGAKRAPGTTVTGASVVLKDGIPCWHIVNIGDSRTYLWRDQGIKQITVDHSARSLRSNSAIPRNVITRALGAGLRVQASADEWLIPIKQGDIILACSDGLYTEVSQRRIRQILEKYASGNALHQCAQELIAAALSGAGKDNVTVVLAYAAHVAHSAQAYTDQPEADETIEDPFAGDDTYDDEEWERSQG